MENTQKPACKLTGEDGNVFNLIGIASKALKRAGQPDKAKEMSTKVFGCGSYEKALEIIQEYVEVE
jgi:single-stranded DNA-binding protein